MTRTRDRLIWVPGIFFCFVYTDVMDLKQPVIDTHCCCVFVCLHLSEHVVMFWSHVFVIAFRPLFFSFVFGTIGRDVILLFSVPTYRILASYKSAHLSVGGDQK